MEKLPAFSAHRSIAATPRVARPLAMDNTWSPAPSAVFRAVVGQIALLHETQFGHVNSATVPSRVKLAAQFGQIAFCHTSGSYHTGRPIPSCAAIRPVLRNQAQFGVMGQGWTGLFWQVSAPISAALRNTDCTPCAGYCHTYQDRVFARFAPRTIGKVQNPRLPSFLAVASQKAGPRSAPTSSTTSRRVTKVPAALRHLGTARRFYTVFTNWISRFPTGTRPSDKPATAAFMRLT